MNADITINDGTTSRTYKSAMGGPQRVKANVVEHLRKTAEFDDTPETLLSRFTRDGLSNRSTLVLEKVKVNATTGRRVTMRTTMNHFVEPGTFTQAESDNQVKELAILANTSGVATDISQGNL